MKKEREVIHHTLVTLFNDVLRIEEQNLRSGEFTNLSMREMHVIEAVCESGDDNAMTSLAARLHITTGSLTVAISTLVKKGYVSRLPSKSDRRMVHIHPTDKGLRAFYHHLEFHQEMIDAVLGCLDPAEIRVLIKALQNVDAYFKLKETKSL